MVLEPTNKNDDTPSSEARTTNENKVELKTKKKLNLLWLWIALAVVISGGAMAVFAYRSNIKNHFWPPETITSTTTSSSDTTVAETPDQATTAIVDTGVIWLSNRVLLSDLNLFRANGSHTDDPGPGYSGTTYYKVGTTTDGGDIILAVIKIEELGNFYDFHHFLSENGVYYWLAQNSDDIDYTYYTRTTSETNNTLGLSSLLPDKTITTGETILAQDPTNSRKAIVESTTTGTKIDDTKWGGLYLLNSGDLNKTSSDIKIATYYILRNDGVKIIYTPSPSFRRDDATLNITWSNTVGQGQKFSTIRTSGCGNAGGSFPMMVDQSSLATKVKVGQSASGSPIYTVAATSTLADLIYVVYQMDGMTGKVSKETMMSDLGVLIWQNSYGDWITYMNDKYAPQVECGKPVVYLYPTKDENVSVKVGADITKSEPAYQNGWNVFARTNGQLIVNGQNYPYLFWEGTGLGSYPNINSGTVVERSDVAATITNQLSVMGLNKKEIADFLDFWLLKMPDKPYIRLSWLTTDQMDELAPLAVSPKPDTLIRVFLDSEGLNEKIDLPGQDLPQYARTGFTVVEWGGLLINSK